MQIYLQRLAATTKGIYGPGKNIMPTRALLLDRDAAVSFATFERDSGGLIYSDVFRSAAGSLQAVQDGRGAQPPAYSGHNYGFSFDVDVDGTLKAHGWTYQELLDFLGKYGWFCYRRDGQRGKEDWHFNCLDTAKDEILSKIDPNNHNTWAQGAELLIEAKYGNTFQLSVESVQTALSKINMYYGSADGKVGPLTNSAALVFARAWNLDPGTAVAPYTPRFQRTLAYIAAELVIRE